MSATLNRYVERTAREGRLHVEPVLPEEDGGTGDRWSATWAASMDGLPDIDASAQTIEEALVYLVYGLGREVLELREKLAATQEP